MHFVNSMAYVGAAPWHGLGRRLSANQPLNVWAEEADMDWQIEAADVQFMADPSSKAFNEYPEQKVLYRSDTKAPLSIVSHRYKVVQPVEILEFYRDLTEVGGYELETAGVLKGGKKFWALARTKRSVTLKGCDTVHGYVLLATACDGTLATTAQLTSVRVVCNNTLAVALGNTDSAVKVPHRSEFDAQAVKQQMGIAIASWSSFSEYIKELAECRVADNVVERLLGKVFANASQDTPGRSSVAVNEQAIRKVRALYAGQGRGAELASARGTVWGVVNSVTEYVDHHRRARSRDHRRARSRDHRQDASWFGQGAALKQRAFKAALELIS